VTDPIRGAEAGRHRRQARYQPHRRVANLEIDASDPGLAFGGPPIRRQKHDLKVSTAVR
jgi:hypothetical protein